MLTCAFVAILLSTCGGRITGVQTSGGMNVHGILWIPKGPGFVSSVDCGTENCEKAWHLSSSTSKWKELPWKSELRLGSMRQDPCKLSFHGSWVLEGEGVTLPGLHMFLIQLKWWEGVPPSPYRSFQQLFSWHWELRLPRDSRENSWSVIYI